MAISNVGLDLIRSLKRSTVHCLPPYEEEKVRRCIDEMKLLYEANRQDVVALRPTQSSSSCDESSENLIQTVLIRHAVMERIKRCLLAYHHARLMRIKELRWQYNAVIPKEIRRNFSPEELKWFTNYCSSLANFMQADATERGGAGGMDLTQSLKPPKSLVMEVRCLKDYGEFETEDGCLLNLTKGSQHLMFRSDCESLVRQGILQHIDD
ncbi:hypothetical protein AAHC03_0912 [Spirometra sp. Aus1]